MRRQDASQTVLGVTMFGLTKLRLIEVGIALMLTAAAVLFVVLTVWAVESARIRVSDAWARPTLGENRSTAAYMTIINETDAADVLKSARAPTAKSVELHQTTTTPDGVMQMREIEDGLPIGAGDSLKLEPGGTHLMLVGLNDALAEGETLTVTLEFAQAGALDVVVPVSASGPAPTGSPEHPHH